MSDVPEPLRLRRVFDRLADIDPSLYGYVDPDTAFVGVSKGDADYYLYIAKPEIAMKIRRDSKLVLFKDGVIVVDLGSEGPVGIHIIFRKKRL